MVIEPLELLLLRSFISGLDQGSYAMRAPWVRRTPPCQSPPRKRAGGMDRETKNRRELSLLLKFRRSLRSP